MRYYIGTYYQPATINIKVSAKKQCNINIHVYDSSQAFTYHTRRSRWFAPGEQKEFSVQMPVTGKGVVINVFEDGGDESCFEIKSMRKKPIIRTLNSVDQWDKNIKSFIPFAKKFAFNAGVLKTYDNRDYINRAGLLKIGPEFRIRYVDVIMEGGVPHLTPARIGIEDKLIEISKEKFQPMTIPARACIEFHEFSHLFVNKDMRNESEADINGLKMYFACGYPVIEAKEMFIEIFSENDSQENNDRYDKVKSFIEQYEKIYHES